MLFLSSFLYVCPQTNVPYYIHIHIIIIIIIVNYYWTFVFPLESGIRLIPSTAWLIRAIVLNANQKLLGKLLANKWENCCQLIRILATCYTLYRWIQTHIIHYIINNLFINYKEFFIMKRTLMIGFNYKIIQFQPLLASFWISFKKKIIKVYIYI